jgi:hypothetical protein
MKGTMSGTLKAAFLCYLLSLPLLYIFGLIYIFRSEFMPYHAVAVGQSWSEVDPAYQVLILALMKVAGAGLLGIAFSINIFLFKFFRHGIQWSFWAIPITGSFASLSTLYATIYVSQNTPASPPVLAASLGFILLILGFILSLLSTKTNKFKEH